MLKKIALFSVALFVVLVMAPQAQAQSYGPKLPTTTTITVVTAADGQPLVVRFSVSASDGSSPAGTLSYTVSRASGAARTARVVTRANSGALLMAGTAKTVNGPVAHVGSYVIGANFSPSNAARYLPSSNVDRATVGESVEGSSSTTVGAAGGGGLPNTGGPDVAWLLAGLALVGAGAGTIAFARRRTPAAA